MGYRLLKLVKMVGSALASGPSSAKNGIPNRDTDTQAGNSVIVPNIEMANPAYRLVARHTTPISTILTEMARCPNTF